MLGSVGAQRERKEVERLNVPWKSHQLSLTNLSSHFQLSALFSRIIDGACEAQRPEMKMSHSLGSRTRAMAKGGQQEEQHIQYLLVCSI